MPDDLKYVLDLFGRICSNKLKTMSISTESDDSPMIRAISSNNAKEIYQLLLNGEDIEAEVLQDYTALAFACAYGYPDCVRMLLESGADDGVQTTNRRCSILHLAAYSGDVETVKLTLECRIGINTLTKNQETPLHYALLRNSYPVAKVLIENGVKVNNISMAGDEENIEFTPLIVATLKNNVEIMRMLINAGANTDPNVKPPIMPFHYACQDDDLEAVNVLIAANANVNAKTHEFYTPLHYAVECNSIRIVRVLLQQKNIDIDISTTSQYTPLHLACLFGHTEIATMLLQKGANPDKIGFLGFTPLLFAIKSQSFNIVNHLIHQYRVDITRKTRENWTALHLAVHCNAPFLVTKYFITKGLDVNAKNNQSRNVLHFIAEKNAYDLLEFLLKESAKISNNSHPDKDNSSDQLTLKKLNNSKNDSNSRIKVNSYLSGDDPPRPFEILTIQSKSDYKSSFTNKSYDSYKIISLKGSDIANNNNFKIVIPEKNHHGDSNVISLKQSNNPGGIYGKKCKPGGLDLTSDNVEYNSFGFFVKKSTIDSSGINGSTSKILDDGLDSSFEDAESVEEVLSKNSARTYTNSSSNKCKSGSDLNDCTNSDWVSDEKNMDEDSMEILLKEPVNVNCIDANYWTPLHYAAWKGHLRLTELLVSNGADIEAKTCHGRNTALHLAAENNHADVLQFLLDNNAKINATDIHGWTPLHCAVEKGHEETVVILLQRGAKVDQPDTKYKDTAMHIMARNNMIKLIDILIEYGSDLNGKSVSGILPIHIACASATVDTFRIMLKKGAYYDAKITYTSGQTITPTNLAKEYKNVEVFKLLNIQDEFFLAVRNQNVFEIKRLLDKGALINCCSARFKTALIYAVWRGYLHIVTLLLEHAADVTVAPEGNVTALHYAAKFNYRDIVFLLLKHGAVYNANCKDGNKTPLNFARNARNVEIAHIFHTIDDLFNLKSRNKKEEFETKLVRIKHTNRDHYLAYIRARNREGETLLVSNKG